MYEAMVEKDTATLNSVHADDFVLTHMTGMLQSKQVYIAVQEELRGKGYGQQILTQLIEKYKGKFEILGIDCNDTEEKYLAKAKDNYKRCVNRYTSF